MKLKEIAELVHKDERTVRRWIEHSDLKIRKSENGRKKLKSEYDKEEVIKIIEKGMGSNFGDIFRGLIK